MNKIRAFRNPINVLFKYIYWPICRAYSRYIVGDRPADPLYSFLCSVQFRLTHRFWPNFARPRRFSEKLWSLMLFERDPRMTMLTDKLLVRDYVAAKAGSEYLIPLLWSGEKPEEIPFDQLPINFVIKANHGCGYNIFVKDKTQLDRAITVLKLKRWLNENFCSEKYLGTEWAYKNIKPTIIIEKFIEQNGKLPADYKFWCFSGRVECVILYQDRFENLTAKILDRDFNPIELRFNVPEYSGVCQRPKNYGSMVQLAESLANGFGFVRVDLYNVEGKILFGELTFYHGGVSYEFRPASQDYFFGEKWKQR